MAQRTDEAFRSDGLKIRRLRKLRGLSVDEMTGLLREQGIDRHPDTIRRGEAGRANLGFKVVNAMAVVLGVDSEELLLPEDN